MDTSTVTWLPVSSDLHAVSNGKYAYNYFNLNGAYRVDWQGINRAMHQLFCNSQLVISYACPIKMNDHSPGTYISFNYSP